jgi:hypothetical protein
MIFVLWAGLVVAQTTPTQSTASLPQSTLAGAGTSVASQTSIAASATTAAGPQFVLAQNCTCGGSAICVADTENGNRERCLMAFYFTAKSSVQIEGVLKRIQIYMEILFRVRLADCKFLILSFAFVCLR